MLEKLDIVQALFPGLDYASALAGSPVARLSMPTAALEHVLAQDDGKRRLVQHVTELSQAFALAVPAPDALAIRDEVAFFQAVRAALVKPTRELPVTPTSWT